MEVELVITIGVKLRELRKKRNISLLELSKATGMGYSFLSGLENDKHSITIVNLSKLADFFGVNLIYFLETKEEELQIDLIRADEAQKFQMEGGMIFQILTPAQNKNIQTSKLYLPPHTPKEPQMHNHKEGEENIVLVEGQLNIKIGEKEFILNKGDSISFNSAYEHCMYTKTESAEFVLTTSPPMGIE